jgi:hypothetical protein
LIVIAFTHFLVCIFLLTSPKDLADYDVPNDDTPALGVADEKIIVLFFDVLETVV